jgi:histone-lysine N-methyltransferase SETD2
MAKWKLSIRNKVEDAKIEEPVSMCLQSKEEDIRSMASSLLDYWGGLESVYRIPRKIVVVSTKLLR